LEDFVWNHLEQLFQFFPLKRQYISKGEICDILALKDKQLAILELKNSEDRYIVQQLSRYYDSLIDELTPVREIANTSRHLTQK